MGLMDLRRRWPWLNASYFNCYQGSTIVRQGWGGWGETPFELISFIDRGKKPHLHEIHQLVETWPDQAAWRGSWVMCSTTNPSSESVKKSTSECAYAGYRTDICWNVVIAALSNYIQTQINLRIGLTQVEKINFFETWKVLMGTVRFLYLIQKFISVHVLSFRNNHIRL